MYREIVVYSTFNVKRARQQVALKRSGKPASIAASFLFIFGNLLFFLRMNLLHYKSYSSNARCLVSSIGHAEMALAEFQHKREANYAGTY